MPAFVIFHDSTLAGIASHKPKSLDDLAQISGIGAKKLERYGEAIMELLLHHMDTARLNAEIAKRDREQQQSMRFADVDIAANANPLTRQ